jgi:hypothetical protein
MGGGMIQWGSTIRQSTFEETNEDLDKLVEMEKRQRRSCGPENEMRPPSRLVESISGG